MKKYLLGAAAAAAVVSTSAMAGGVVMAPPCPYCWNIVPYADFQLGWAWQSTANINDVTVNNQTVTATVNKKHFAGRVALGLGFVSTKWPQITWLSEIGYGYYNKYTYNYLLNGAATNESIAYKMKGLDVLGGVKYNWTPQFNLFLKLGAMVATSEVDTNNSPTYAPEGLTTRRYSTAALPETVLGAGWDFSPNWGINLAWTHVFGNTPKQQNNFSNPAQPVYNDDVRTPTLNTLLIGLEVRMA